VLNFGFTKTPEDRYNIVYTILLTNKPNPQILGQWSLLDTTGWQLDREKSLASPM
jgi:hypothetical protein